MELSPRWISTLKNFSLPLVLVLHLYFKLFNESFLLYGDEAFTVFHAQKNVNSLLQFMSQDASPITFYLILSGWIKLFGVKAMVVKILPVLFSLGSAVLIFFFAKKRMGYRSALLASFLFLLSNLHFDFSHEIRVYSMVSFLALASYNLFFELLEDPFNKKNMLLYTITTIALPYCHYNAALVPFTQFLSLLFLYPKKLWHYRNVFITYVAAFCLFIPQLFHFRKIVPDESFWLQKPDLTSLKFVLIELFGNAPWFMVLLVLLILLIIPGLSSFSKIIYKQEFNKKYLLIFLMWYLIPILLNFLIAQYTPVFRLRYVLFSSFGLFFAFVYCLSMLRFPRISWMLSIVLLGCFILSFSPKNRNIEDWENTSEIVRNEKGPNTAVILSASYKFIDFSYYYDISAFKAYDKTADQLNQQNVFPIKSVKQLNSLIDLSRFEKILLVLSHNEVEDPEGLILNHFLKGDYHLVERYGSDIQAKVYVFQNNASHKQEEVEKIDEKRTFIKCYEWIKSVYSKYEKIQMTYALSNNSDPSCPNVEKFENGSLMIGPKNSISPTFKISSTGVNKVKVLATFEETDYQDVKFVVSLEKNLYPFNKTIHLETLERNEYLLASVKNQDSTETLNTRFSVNIKDRYKNEQVELVIYVWNYGGENVLLKGFEVGVEKGD